MPGTVDLTIAGGRGRAPFGRVLRSRAHDAVVHRSPPWCCAGGDASCVGPVAAVRITDNSFLVEEAFNQEAKIFQNIFNWTRVNDVWLASFTQEWPVPGQRHQLSYTLLVTGGNNVDGFGDTLINYRLQVLDEVPGHPAFSPRVSAILPTGSRAVGAHQGGVQVNLPFSKQHKDFYFHWNAGLTWLPRENRGDLLSQLLAGSAIYRIRAW